MTKSTFFEISFFNFLVFAILHTSSIEILLNFSKHWNEISLIKGTTIFFESSELNVLIKLSSFETDLIISEILILLLSFARLYPPFGPLDPTRILFLTRICSVCSRYLFGIPCLLAIDSF